MSVQGLLVYRHASWMCAPEDRGHIARFYPSAEVELGKAEEAEESESQSTKYG